MEAQPLYAGAPEKAIAAVILRCSAMGVVPRLAGSDKSYAPAILLQLYGCVHGLYQLQAHGKGTNMAHLAQEQLLDTA